MNNKIVIGIIVFLLLCIIIIYKLIKINMDNKYTKNYNECIKNLYSNYQENGIIVYIYTFNNKLQFKKFYDVEKYMEFKDASQNYIKDVEFMKINSYDNYIQLE
jgi:sorbitol-specific phosphotransferase system component IIC